MKFKINKNLNLFFVVIFIFFNSTYVVAAVPTNVQNVFINNTCLSCHSGNNPQGGLSLDDATVSETSMVDIVANCSINNETLVDTNTPSDSILTQKLSNQNPNCGGVMPPNGNLISTSDLNIINDWIISIGPASQFGLISFAEAVVNVNESESTLLVSVNRELGFQGDVSVDFNVDNLSNDSAMDGLDFEAQTGTVSFSGNETSKEIIINLIDDDILEETEMFSVVLSNPTNGAILGNQNLLKVEIIDNETNDIPGTFFFAKQSVNLEENVGQIEIKINRSFGAKGQVTVVLKSSDGSALSNSDYEAVDTVLVFDEEVKEQFFTLIIIDDTTEEPFEQFQLTLSSPTNGALLSSVSQIDVGINDNDALGDTGETGGGDTDIGTDAPEDEVDFESAGSISYLLSLLLFILYSRKFNYKNNVSYKG